MIKDIHLTLMIGPAVPVPVPRVVLDALTAVEVRSNTEGASGFSLTFDLPNGSPLTTLFLLAGGAAVPPMVRVVIIATLGGIPNVLMDGVMTNHQVSPGGGGSSGNATLTVTGEDLSRVMDYIDFSGIPYPAMPREARVLLILAKYAWLGVVPLVIPSLLPDVPIPVQEIPRQQGKDLAYVRSLAEEVGYVFYVNPGPAPGMSVAYWGPQIKVGIPQPALSVNMDAHTNVEQLSFTFDSEGKTLPVMFVHNALTKVPIPIPLPDVSPLNPPLGLAPPIPKNIEPVDGAAKYGTVRAALLSMARASRSGDAVTGNGSLDVLRYGRVLKARGLVGVRGVGQAFDGLYYVKDVTHHLKRGEYKQNFTLTRNGLVSTVPRVLA